VVEAQKLKAAMKDRQEAELANNKLDFSRVETHAPTPSSILSELQIWSNPPSPLTAIPRSISICKQDPGVNFFFHHYMTVPSPASIGQTDIFSSQLWRGVSQTKPFLDAISCVGLAGLSNVNNDPEMMMVARQKYAITLRRVMSALQVPGSADMGYTLKAVMMLALFEASNPKCLLLYIN